MKEFKAQKIDTEAVKGHVKNLFRGYNKLIWGFNDFLPDGQSMDVNEEDQNEPDQANPEYAASSSQPQVPLQSQAAMDLQAQQAQQQQQQQQQGSVKPPAMVQQQHAISYVTTIRNRFANEPDTYRSFLKILHTYQKEQKGIKDVLEQVSLLFSEHPDLLMEFTYFLPDAVQDQAKERLNRAARESEMRRRMMLAQQQNQAQQMMGGKRTAAGGRKNAQYHQQVMQQQHAMQQAQMQQRRAQKGGYGLQQQQVYGQQVRRFDDGRSRESAHISQTTERRFFDSVKDLLTSTTRDGWSEFVKQLDLFVNNAINKKDLFCFAADVFGPGGQDLFHELKRIMAARADYEGHGTDMYYAIPSVEIDWSTCDKCSSPSYRALPKDYPKLYCSERSKLEESVLNDEWVTYPLGIESPYTFRHMIKNQAEEELFKTEEDRFELDMIIDSNHCTIRILEPIAEEIANMRNLEDREVGNAGPRFQLQLEKRNISCIHLNSISRLYGEHGAEILELLHKNPAGTIPILLKRLKQKDLEWRKARQDLNVKWTETVERNYERSFDHRSFYFKRQDRRFSDPKQLCNDVRDWVPAGEPGSSLMVGETPPLAPADASTTGGAAALATSTTVDVAELELSQVSRSLFLPCNGHVDAIGRMGRPLASTVPLLRGAKPQLALRFPKEHHGLHKDIYSIFCHVAETASLPTSDKERVSFIWRDLLRPLFNMPVHYLYSDMSSTAAAVLADAGAGAQTKKAEEEGGRPDSAMDNMESGGSQGLTPTPGSTVTMAVAAGLTAATLDAVPTDAMEAWHAGTRVLTAYGPGVIIAYRQADGMYVVGMFFGKLYCKPSSIIGAEVLSPAALAALDVKIGADDSHTVAGIALPTVATFTGDPNAVPAAAGPAGAGAGAGRGNRKDKTTAAVSSKSSTHNEVLSEPCRMFLSTPLGYTFIRMYHTIYTRLVYARELGEIMSRRQFGTVTSDNMEGGIRNTVQHPLSAMDTEDLEAQQANSESPKPIFSLWMGQFLGLLDATLDSVHYEDACRQLLGNRSYCLFTLDKLVQNCFRCLQQMANEESFNKLVGLFVYHRSRTPAFITMHRLAESGANYAVAIGATPAPVKRGQAAVASGATSIKNIEAVAAAVAKGGVDPISYTVHTAKIMEHSNDDLYRIQVCTDGQQGPFDGDSVVICQLLGALGSGNDIANNNLRLACVGSPAPKAPNAMDLA